MAWIACMVLLGGWIGWLYRRIRFLQEEKGVLDILAEGVMVFSFAGVVRYLNPAAAQMLGVVRKKVIGSTLTASPGVQEKILVLFLEANERKEPVTDTYGREEDQQQPLDLLMLPFAQGLFLVLQDRANKQKVFDVGKDFVANASHELKTPITIIRGFAETLQDAPELPYEMVSDILDKIVRSCSRMDTLVRNLLMLSDIEHLPLLHSVPCDLIALIEECIRITQSMHPEVHFMVQKKTDRSLVRGEASLLELAIGNILENGVKYSSAPAQITIRIQNKQEEVEVQIQDCGMGIPAADIDHIFERFYTVNKAHSRRLGGAGLGLSLVKKIIDKHEGAIQVSSVLHQGSTFTLILPRLR